MHWNRFIQPGSNNLANIIILCGKLSDAPLNMAEPGHPAITVDVENAGDKPSKLRMILTWVTIAVSVLASAVLFWKFWYCPGRLGYFSWFRCNCVSNSTRENRRCTCDMWFNENGAACTPCGDSKQECCQKNLACRDRLFPPPVVHFQCNETTKLCEENILSS